MSRTRAVWLFIAALTTVRLSMLPSTDLEFDEAHYWMWSERLAQEYFSKGPGIAFAIRAGMAIFGSNEFVVRLLCNMSAGDMSLRLYSYTISTYVSYVCTWAV